MSLDVWLKRGKRVTVGGRELIMMPLPLRRLYGLGSWLEENSSEVIKEIIASGSAAPNPLAMVARVLARVNVSEVCYLIFSIPRDPDTGEQINKNISVEFFDEYLDVPVAQELFKQFIELNELENLIKNLQSLPVVKKLMEASSLAFGIPFLNSLQLSTASSQNKPEGSQFLKSTDSSTQPTSERQETGGTKNQQRATGSRVM